ncbi:HipA domain-containing protein [Streptobacillus felis]|uniref:HipA domain-containing protein n=1 Tax=Streptobacillus felis TaxID=1384509 RepID=UPI000836EF73|nr:HipA domain-containing protein [Streptobacillus felis]
MIDFQKAEINLYRVFDGANGNKISIYYDERLYMLKFPSYHPKENFDTKSTINEHISCLIAKELGLNSQNTLLGMYNDKIVVACEDFQISGYKLVNFTSIKNSIVDSEKMGKGLNLNSILYTIENQKYVNKNKLKEFFWDTFILDSLIANGDRHNGNWGLLINETDKLCKIAPIYDCGSSFHSHLNDEEMLNIIENDKNTLNNLVMGKPNSAIKINNKQINYYNFLTTTDNQDCLESLVKITKKIDLTKIGKLIDEIEYMTDIHKKFIKTILHERKTKILDKALILNNNISKWTNKENIDKNLYR